MFMIGESSLRVAARCSAAWVIICANEPNCRCRSPRTPDTPSCVVLSRCLTNHFGSAESFALCLTLCWRRRPSLCSFEEYHSPSKPNLRRKKLIARVVVPKLLLDSTPPIFTEAKYGEWKNQ